MPQPYPNQYALIGAFEVVLKVARHAPRPSLRRRQQMQAFHLELQDLLYMHITTLNRSSVDLIAPGYAVRSASSP